MTTHQQTPAVHEPAEQGSTREGSVTPARPDAGYVAWLLAVRTHPSVRSDLRRADVSATADRAYPHLARFWSGQSWRRTPILLHAASAASYQSVRHRDGAGVGHVAAQLASKGTFSVDTVGRRLLAVQRMDLPTAHRHLTTLLRAAAVNGTSLDWYAHYRLYLGWDQKDIDRRRDCRRRLLEDFYQ